MSEEDIKILKEKIEFWKNDPRIMIQEENYKILQVLENILKERLADKEMIEQKDKEIQELKKEYYSLINKIENKIDKFDYKFEKAKRKNDNDRANYYWDLIIKFAELLKDGGE